MKQKNILLSILFLVSTGYVFATNNNSENDSGSIIDEGVKSFMSDSFDDVDKAFSGPQNTTNFPSETLFSLSDIGRKTYHMYRSTNYRLTRLANYQPLQASTATNEALSSPMLKVTGSSITVDLNGFHLERQTRDVDGNTTVNAVGIEIGYSPYDAAQNKFGLSGTPDFTTVAQPENVTIKNGRIGNFGIGIVIHAGVKNVTLENLTISNAALGVVCAGQADKPAVSIFLKNVRIESDGTDRSPVLAWAKSKLEGSTVNVGYMAYGDGALMPEQRDPVTNTDILNVYSGVLLVNTNNVSVYDVGCTNLGYARTVDEDADAEETPSATFGINAIGCTSLQLEKVDASNNCSERLVSGINISGCTAVTMTDCVATNSHIVVRQENDYDGPIGLTPTTTFGLWARGVSILNSQAVTINGLEVSRTLGASSVGGGLAANKSTAMGLYLNTIKVLNAKNVQSDYNDSQLASAGLTFGVYTTGMDSGVFQDLSASSNTGSAATDIGYNYGGSVSGMFFTGTCNDITLKDVSCNNNTSGAQYSGVSGIACDHAGTFETIRFENVNASNNNNRTSETGSRGVYGIYLGPVTNLSMKNVHADNTSNAGSTSYGIICDDALVTAVFENVTADNSTGGSNNCGIYIGSSSSSNLNFDYCSFSSNDDQGMYFNWSATNVTIKNSRIDSNGDAGIRTGGATNLLIDNCSISNTTGTTVYAIQLNGFATNVKLHKVKADNVTGSATVYGLYIADDIESVEIKDCSFNNYSGTQAYGIYGEGENYYNLLCDTITINNIQGTNGQAASIYFYNEDQDNHDINTVIFKNIAINNITSSTNHAYGIYFGINDDDDGYDVFARNIYVQNCKIERLSADSYVSGIYFDFWSDSNGNIEGIHVQDVAVGSCNAQGIDAIYISSEDYIHNILMKNVIIHSCESQYCSAIYFDSDVQDAQLLSIFINNIQTSSDDSYGIYFDDDVKSLNLDTCIITNFNSSEDSYGIYFDNDADSVSIKNTQCSNLQATNDSAGIYFDDQASNIIFENVQACNNSASTGVAHGIYMTSHVQTGLFKNLVASNNAVTGVVGDGTTYTPGSYAAGIHIVSGSALTFEDINCSYNVGPDTTQITNDSDAGDWNTVSAAGMWLTNPSAVQMNNITCDYNKLSGTTAQGYVFGMLLDDPSSVTIDSISCSNNAGNALGAGLFSNGGSSVSITNGLFNNNTSVAGRVTTTAVISSGVNMSKHTTTPVLTVTNDDDDTFDNPELLKGSYGILMFDVDNLTLDTVTASQNSGFRAFGVHLNGCSGVRMTDCITNQQQADGQMWVDTAQALLQAGTHGDAVVVPACTTSITGSAPDIFGSDVTAGQTVDAQALMQDFLDTVKLLKDAIETPEIIDNVHTMYSYHKSFVETSMLLRAIVAQARAWGVAVGTQLNNCTDAVITNLVACANTSEEDCAYGLIFANNCKDCKVYGGQFNNNKAWIDSELDITAGQIYITDMVPFWAAMGVDLPNFDGAYFDAYTSGDYGVLTTADADGTTGRFTLRLSDDTTIKELCTPCGPMAAGIVIGDTTQRVDISDVVCAGNNGNAGQAYGLIHDVSTGASVQNSRFFQNMSNTCGIAFGLADFTPQSLSVHLGNSAFGNQYHLFMDSNYIVPFHPGAPYNMEFPVKVGYNGNITTLANASPYDNIEIQFTYHAPQDPTGLPDGVFDDWADEYYIEDAFIP